MRRFLLNCSLILAAALAFAPLAKTPSRTVVLLTMDGVRWDYPSRDNLPNFARLAREGARAPRLTPVFPSLTFPSHAAIATGCPADLHGIVSNVFLDRSGDRRFSDEKEASWFQEPPLWALAEQRGLRAAVSGWPCSSGPWRGVSPSYYHPFGQSGNDEETERWIEAALSRDEAHRPALVMAWTSGADGPGHAEGPDSEAVRRAMARADRLLGRLLDFLSRDGRKNYATLLLASDHGMTKVTRSIDIASLIPKRGYYPFVAISGPLCNVYCKNQAQEEAVLRALRSAAPKIQIWRKAELPARLRYACPRTGDIILLAPPGTTFAPLGEYKSEAAPKGMHGYDPENCPDMGGIFYAWGAEVAAGTKLPELTTLDVAPTACALLNIPPPPRATGKTIKLQ